MAELNLSCDEAVDVWNEMISDPSVRRRYMDGVVHILMRVD